MIAGLNGNQRQNEPVPTEATTTFEVLQDSSSVPSHLSSTPTNLRDQAVDFNSYFSFPTGFGSPPPLIELGTRGSIRPPFPDLADVVISVDSVDVVPSGKRKSCRISQIKKVPKK